MTTLRTTLEELQSIATQFKNLDDKLTSYEAMKLALMKTSLDAQEERNQALVDILELTLDRETFEKEYYSR